jgi:hypothetical protein
MYASQSEARISRYASGFEPHEVPDVMITSGTSCGLVFVRRQ